MAGPRARPRRRGAGAGSSATTTTSKVLMGAVGMFSLLYLLASHFLVTRDAQTPSSTTLFAPPAGGGAAPATIDDDHYSYESDPRSKGAPPQNLQRRDHPAQGPMDYIELQCDAGTPDVDLSYWKDIPRDKAYESPWGAPARKAHSEGGMTQYVTFEPDHGGFNNIRMAMETMIVFARETGRTLVMPAAQKFYLVTRPAVEFADMFPVEYLSDYMGVMSMEEFLEKEGLTGRLGKRPPGNKKTGHKTDVLHGYLREVADFIPHWDHMGQALVFGPSPENPSVPHDAESQAWLTNFITDKRRELGYSEEMQRARHIHFRTSRADGDPNNEYRLFTHFYTFLGFNDPVAARHHRRLVRDVVHFREFLFCAAATIVGRLRAAGEGTPGRWSGYYGEWGGLGDGEDGDPGDGGDVRRAGFSTFHIRRGDFQYKRMKPPAETIKEATKELIRPGEVIFIATDERKKAFFDVFLEDHRVFYLDDFKDVLEGIDPSYYLMIDTIVAAHGRTFIGTWRSTFTGYITRLRGYYRFPTEFSWYFWNEGKQQYIPTTLAMDTTPRSPFFMREWPTAWEDIDQDMMVA